ncbi:MAG: toll/interleukin-1 receptor domain-containing protein [Magnetococcales bacterium]|nr:toll/interleukin-1 receptor domain-containing protein [Magnetococcales bacterium]
MSQCTVFVSYCRADKRALKPFMPFQTTLEREGLITVWTDDRQIKPGDRWRSAIEAALAQSRVAILFISEHFLASSFIQDNELPPLLAACEAGRLTVLPVFLSPSTVDQAGISFVHPDTGKPATITLTEFQGFGTLDETLAEMRTAEKQRVFVDLAKRIRELARQVAPDMGTTGTERSPLVPGGKKVAAAAERPPIPPRREEGRAQPARHPVRPTVAEDLNQKAEAFIQAVYAPASKSPGASDEEYQKIYAEEGERKSRYIVDFLRKKQEKGVLDLKFCRFLSIGGADGSEAESVLRQTEIPEGALIEISTYAANLARQRAVRLKAETGKILHVKEGDAAQSLEEVIGWLKPAGHLCLVTSIQAVLHELQTRSPLFKTSGYDFSIFFGKLFSPFQNNIFFAREPVKPEQWPERVKIHIPGLSGDRLQRLAQIVHDRMRFACADPEQNPDDYVLMDATLAVETLHKFLRSKDPQEFKYELGEQLTRLDTVTLKALIGSSLNDPRAVVTESFTTEGFAEQFLEFQVQAKKIKKSTELGIPVTHARFVACKLVPLSRQEEEPKRPEKPAEQAEEIPPAEPVTEPFRRTDRDVRYRRLEQWVTTAIKASGAVMDLLEKKLPQPMDGNRTDKVGGLDRAMGLTKGIMAVPFEFGQSILLDIYKKMEADSDPVGIDAIKKTSRLLIPWLYVASRKMEIEQWEYGSLGDIRTIPAGIMAFAEIVLAGIDNREIAWKEISDPLCFPQGFYGVNLQPEGGFNESTEKYLREDLFKTVKPPAEVSSMGETEKDDAIARRIRWLFSEQGIRVYLIVRVPSGEAGDRYKEQIERIKRRYPVLAVVMLDTKLMGEHQTLFDEIRSLLL